MTEFSSALVTRAASLRDNPQYSDIIIPTRSFHAHKIILSARSSDWGRGVDLSSSVVLDWKAFSDQTCGALLRVHLENGHKFRPEQVLEDMRKHGAAPDKETYQCLISRHCQEEDIECASKVLQLMKNQGIKINENMFNSLILGHREAGDLLTLMKQCGPLPQPRALPQPDTRLRILKGRGLEVPGEGDGRV